MQNIIDAFESFMRRYGTYYSLFYIGIATDPVDRLKNGHNVDQSIPHIYWDQALQTETVRAVERYFLDKGCKGDAGGGDEDTNFIYSYLITPKTRE